PQRTLVAQAHFELGLALAECPLLAVGQLDGKGRRDLAHTDEQCVARRCGCRHSAIPRLGQAPGAGQRPRADKNSAPILTPDDREMKWWSKPPPTAHGCGEPRCWGD